MLKELRDIGEYVNRKNPSQLNALVEPLKVKTRLYTLKFDGDKIFFDDFYKEVEEKDFELICFRKGAGANGVQILPNDYWRIKEEKNVKGKTMEDREFDKYFANFDKIQRTLGKLVANFPEFTDVYNSYKLYLSYLNKLEGDFLKLKNIISTIENKGKNREESCISISIKGSYLNTIFENLNFEDGKYYYFGEIEFLKKYFISNVMGEEEKTEKGFCHVCELLERDLIISGFPYKFYNLDKPGFAYDLNDKNGYKSFGVCVECYGEIRIGYKFFKEELSRNIFGENTYIILSFPILGNIDKNKLFSIFDKYNTDKSDFGLEKLENNIKNDIENGIITINDKGKITRDFFDMFFNYGDLNDIKNLLLPFIKINFIFGKIDTKASDRLVIKYFLKDILPSRLGKYYKSIKLFNRKLGNNENILSQLAKSFFGDISNLGKIYSSLPDLYLYPTYEKNKYVWNIKNFFEIKGGEQNYYKFLDIYMHNGKYKEEDFWSLVYEKLKQDFIEKYLKSKDGNLKFSLWEIYLIYRYMTENELLTTNSKNMKDLNFNSTNKNINYLEEYFRQSDLFDSYDKIYIALVGFYVKLFINKQKSELGSNPFITQIDFERLDYDGVLKLLNTARGKFNKYSSKKFAYYPELYRLILEMSMRVEKSLKRDQIVYYFSIGMEILGGVYWKDKTNESEEEIYEEGEDEIN